MFHVLLQPKNLFDGYTGIMHVVLKWAISTLSLFDDIYKASKTFIHLESVHIFERLGMTMNLNQ